MATIKDVVLVYLEDAPIFFARVESILPDVKKNWFQIKLLILQIPMQVVTWILKDAYINGEEFQMNGKNMRIEKVETPVEALPFAGEEETLKEFQKEEEPDPETPSGEKGRIISFADLKKKK